MAVIALERMAAHPDLVALRDEGGHLTWAQLGEMVSTRALRAPHSEGSRP